MGEYNMGSTEEPQGHIDRKVQIVASHPKFDPKTFEYDLALLRFYEPIDFQPNVIPICIPEGDQDLVGETAWVTGWGRLYEGECKQTAATCSWILKYLVVFFQWLKVRKSNQSLETNLNH